MSLSGVAVCLLSLIVQARDALRPDLGKILEREAQYCLRLEQAALNFVCLEDITEKVNLTKDIKVDQSASFDTMTDGVWVRSKAGVPPRKIKRTFRYDFQFIREGSRIRETRTLLQENGKKRAERNASLKTMNFVYRNALLGPVAIFGQQWRDHYVYEAPREAKIGGQPCVMIDVRPKAPDAKIGFLFGRAYIDKATLEILKIEWSEQRIGNYAVFEKRGERYGLKPRITVTSEFEIEKNGIRFPSQHFIEEAYLDSKGKKFVRSETAVVYSDFKFFTVTIEDITQK